MGLFKKKKSQDKDIDEWAKKAIGIIFPKGEKDIEIGCNELLNILHNKVDKKTAKNILLRSLGLCYTHILREEAIEKERLKMHLSGYALSYFDDKELNEFHIYLLDLQNKICVNQFLNTIPKELAERFLSEIGTNSQACTTNEISNTIGEFGLTPTNPVPVYLTPSNNIYLSRLRTPNGFPIKWERKNSLTTPHIEKSIDKYEIFDNAGNFLTHIYISPYHRITSKKAPKGFTIIGGYTDKPEVIICNSSDDFYDKMFYNYLFSNSFIMAETGCLVTEKDEIVSDSDNQVGIISGYTFLWLRNLYKQNSKLHKHILSLVSDTDDENVSDEDKQFIIKSILGKNIEQIFSDSKALNAIFIRVFAYRSLIKRLTNCFLSFYSEHGNEEDIEYFLSRANSDFDKTANITSVEKITIYDVDKVFVRDMLSGENLTKKNNDISKTETKKNNVLSDIQIQKIKQCIGTANEYLKEKDYKLNDYSIEGCFDLISLWEKKGLPALFHWSGPTGGGCSGFNDETSMECLSKWYKILTGEEISIDQQQYYLNNYRGGLTSGCVATKKMLEYVNFSIFEIADNKTQTDQSDKTPNEQKTDHTFFIDENGDPMVLKHNCLSERIGKEMTKEELHKFAVELLSDLYEKKGMTMLNVNRNYDREYPNIVMKSRNGTLYYVIIETAHYPQKAESLYSTDFTEMKQYAKEFNATPVFAGVSFMNASREWNKLICGDDYFVSFKGLEKI